VSKFLKFKPTLNVDETIQMLEHMTSEKIDAKTIRILIENNYLNPIVGNGFLCVGFDGDSIRALLSGSSVMPTAVSVIGLPAGPVARFTEEEGSPVFLACEDHLGDSIYFALPAIQQSARDEFLREYSFPDLASLDPTNLSNLGFLTPEVMRLGHDANEPIFIGKRVYLAKNLVIEPFGTNSVVSEITGLPFGYSMGVHVLNKEKMKIQRLESQAPSKNLVLAALLEVVVASDVRKWNQEGLANEISDRFHNIRGLSKKTVTNQFSEAKKSLAAARQEAK